MRTKRTFLKEANDLFEDTTGRKVSGDILIHEFKSSDAYQHYDMIKYFMEDGDKAPMAIWDSGEVFPEGDALHSEGQDYLNECWISYCKKMIGSTESLLTALKEEVAAKQIKFELPHE